MPEKTKIHLKSNASSFERNSSAQKNKMKPRRLDSMSRDKGIISNSQKRIDSFERYPPPPVAEENSKNGRNRMVVPAPMQSPSR
jgi:hypothetical protein